ncbi:MAG: hypothetical protein IKM39_02305 [Clostridia bacterium]|nr:hypothetical protein [Clostridia bacterium]
MKRCISFLLVLLLTFSIIPVMPVSAASSSLSFTESDLKNDDTFIPSIDTTIGRDNNGSNSYIAQSFVANTEPITGCRLYFRLGDTATMTIQIRSSLEGGNETVLYSANYPLVSDPHQIHGWWNFEFTRAIQLEASKTYYLVAWCDIYHSYCKMSTTGYRIYSNLTNKSYRRAENSNEWLELPDRSYGYQLITDPNATVKGYPYEMDHNTLILHDAEEYFCFNRAESNTTLNMTGKHSSQGYYSMRLEGSKPDANGAVMTGYVDLFQSAGLNRYEYFYTDVYISQDIKTAMEFTVSLVGKSGNGGQYTTSLKNKSKGWHRLEFTKDQLSKLGNGFLGSVDTVKFQVLSNSYPQGLYFAFDNIRAAKNQISSFTSAYYTDEELNTPSDENLDGDYIGAPDLPTPSSITYGDVTNDTLINAQDALLVLRISVRKHQPTETEVKASDVNADNQINAVDALWILKYAVGKVTEFPAHNIKPEQDIVTSTDFSISTEGLTPNTIYKMNTSAISNTAKDMMPHDAARLISSLQGLINRDVKKNRIALVIVDKYTDTWLSYIQENDPLLEGMDNTVNISSVERFMSIFKNQLIDCGMVLWDPDAPSTANVAQTICGLDGYLPIKYLSGENTLYQQLVDLGVEVKLSLVNKFTGRGIIPGTAILATGSIKCDPYLWALEKYSSRCSANYLVYTPDGASSTEGNKIYEQDVHSKSLDYNHSYGYDYAIYRKAFCFDLVPVETEAPCDDPSQILGTDLATLKEILLNRYYRAKGSFGEVIGFPPWPLKYTSHNGWNKIEATALEGSFTTLISQYNCYMDADGSITNCSLYTQFTLEDSYESIANSKPVTEKFDPNTMYLYMYTGDYDSAAWALEHLYNSYNDNARGSIPITWSINPSISDRIPMLFDYLYKNQTDMDYFSASDSGIGYIRPQGLFQTESDRTLPDGDKEFIKISKEWFKRFDMDSVGFIIGKLSDNVCRTYNQFAPIGSNTNDVSWTPTVYVTTPYARIKNGIGDPAKDDATMQTATSGMYDFAQGMRDYNVAGFRTIKFSASDLKRTQEAFVTYAAEKDPDTTYKFVDYKTYFAMLRESGSGRHVLD